MNSRLLCLFAATLMVALLLSCGGNGLPHTNQVTATVTPAAATVAPGGSVTLTGSASGFTAGPIVKWYIQESKDIDFINDCGFLTSQNPPQGGCPYGYVMFAEDGAAQYRHVLRTFRFRYLPRHL